MSKDEIAIAVLVALVIFLISFGVIAYIRQLKTNRETQRTLSDRDLLQMVANEPDQLLSPHQLRDKTGLSLNEARTRLNSLYTFGVFIRSSNRTGRHFFSLKDPLQDIPKLALSADPFLTVEDLLEIFEHYDYRVTPQELLMATGLPMDILKREMKYFESEKIVQRLQRMDSAGMVTRKFYVLQDPYRSDPDRFRVQASKIDLEMREILMNDNLIV
ncbi:hypothetical protein [Neolewinella persica]|uniref:hypothetical protein n=1 Tax=Neolewinella persica TaxID=70998 RepID=UPI00038124DB|nr:hypothetical protein [Neolewinella persica]